MAVWTSTAYGVTFRAVSVIWCSAVAYLFRRFYPEMKLLKIYISIALVNVFCVVSVVNFGSPLKQQIFSAFEARIEQTGVSVTPTGGVSVVPSMTPKPVKKRVVRVVRKTTPTLSGNATTDQQKAATKEVQANTTDQPAANPTSAPPPPQDTRCIIGIDGSQYDVTAYRSMHPGGDIFTCGADMSATFWSQHGSGTLNKMAKYRL